MHASDDIPRECCHSRPAWVNALLCRRCPVRTLAPPLSSLRKYIFNMFSFLSTSSKLFTLAASLFFTSSIQNLLVKHTMMHLNLSLGYITLVLSFLFASSLGLRPAIDEVYRRHLLVAAERPAEEQAQKRQICVNDTLLQDFEADPYDTYPLCSSLLGYPELTTTGIVTTRTSEPLDLHSYLFLTFFSTIIVLTTVIQSTVVATTATIPSQTISVTETAGIIRKRQATTATPLLTASSLISAVKATSTSDLEPSILSAVYSVCSCLPNIAKSEVETVFVTSTSVCTSLQIRPINILNISDSHRVGHRFCGRDDVRYCNIRCDICHGHRSTVTRHGSL